MTPNIENKYDSLSIELANIINVNQVRRDWMRLSITDQRKILLALEVPVHLPRCVDRFHPKMQEAYETVFSYVEENGAMLLFSDAIAARIEHNERIKFNNAFSGIERRKNPRQLMIVSADSDPDGKVEIIDGQKYWMGSLVHPCPDCGVAPTNVDHCGHFGDPDCPYFGIGREEYEKRTRKLNL